MCALDPFSFNVAASIKMRKWDNLALALIIAELELQCGRIYKDAEIAMVRPASRQTTKASMWPHL